MIISLYCSSIPRLRSLAEMHLASSAPSSRIEFPLDSYDAIVDNFRPEPLEESNFKSESDAVVDRSRLIRGRFTFFQVRSIARLGKIRDPVLEYDSSSDSVTLRHELSVTSLIFFSCLLWNPRFQCALQDETATSSESGLGLSHTEGHTHDFAERRAHVAAELVPHAVEFLTHTGGASCLITAPIATGILSSVDIRRYCGGTISREQLAKNLSVITAEVAGGAAGKAGGTAIGAFVGHLTHVPGGSHLGGFVGGLVGGAAGKAVASEATKSVVGRIEDDADKMMRIFQDEFVVLAAEYVLSSDEVDEVVEHVRNDNPQTTDMSEFCRLMFRETRPKKKDQPAVPTKKTRSRFFSPTRSFLSLFRRRETEAASSASSSSDSPPPPSSATSDHPSNEEGAQIFAQQAIRESIETVLAEERLEIRLKDEEVALLACHQEELFEGIPFYACMGEEEDSSPQEEIKLIKVVPPPPPSSVLDSEENIEKTDDLDTE